jgi:hypothetical protein
MLLVEVSIISGCRAAGRMFNAGVEIGQFLFIGAVLVIVSLTSHLAEGTVYKSRWTSFPPAYFYGYIIFLLADRADACVDLMAIGKKGHKTWNRA